jgi:hypothetical protein
LFAINEDYGRIKRKSMPIFVDIRNDNATRDGAGNAQTQHRAGHRGRRRRHKYLDDLCYFSGR